MLQKILIADNSRQEIETLRRSLENLGFEVTAAYSASEAIKRLKDKVFNLFLGGENIVVEKGQKLLNFLDQDMPGFPAIILVQTERNHPARGKATATQFFTRGSGMDQLLKHVEEVCKNSPSTNEKPDVRANPQPEILLGESPAMRKLRQSLTQIASTDVTVLLKGETGTGKKIAAWFLHQHSKRAGEPLVTVNCAALSPTLLESELFGHEKGAFTGAHKQKLGKFEHTGQGTLFLDEIGELTPPLQSKLLRILDDREFERVGGNRTLRMECRIVTASHIDFPSALKEGRFRADLYHRLNVISVEIPTLRERREDIPLLARYFLKQKSIRHHKRITKISLKAMDQLTQYSWPGNVRELENTIERAVVLSQGQALTEVALPHTQIAEPPFPAPTSPDPTSMTLKAFRDQALEKIEGQYFDHLLTLHQGHISRASAAAGIDRKTFYRKIRKYGIDPKTYKKKPRL